MKSIIFKYRTKIKWIFDVLIWSAVTTLAYLLRFEVTAEIFVAQLTVLTPFIVGLKVLLVTIFGSYRQSWRNSGFMDLFSISKMVVVFVILFLAFIWWTRTWDLISFSVPLSIPAMELLLGIPTLLFPRAMTRFFLIYRLPSSTVNRKESRILIVGAGESGSMVAREMQKHPGKKMKPVAFVDDDPSLLKQKIHGVQVLGTVDDLPYLSERHQATKIIIAMPSADGRQIRRVIEQCQQTDAEYQIIPAIHDLLSGDISISEIRDVDVEDLLRRKPVELDTKDIQSYIKGKRVLVTGAGGSIGSEIVRQVSRFQPEKVILVGRGENSIHLLVREINEKLSNLEVAIKIADVRDRETLEHIFKDEKPHVVFHAAAHKHVPLMEDNPSQAVFNNILGTKNLVETALEFDVKHFINISTDKAVNPTSVMGASKRIAEQIVEDAANRIHNEAVYVSVRFGNVLGSRGSVVPIFKDQIKKGGPVTVTHPEMIRYFMTIPEASQLVLQAGALKMNGAVFVLDMGEPVNIEQMARDLIRLSGLEPDVDIKIKYSGIRPGEKMYEELLTDEEGTTMSHHEKIFVARKSNGHEFLQEQIDALESVAKTGHGDLIRAEIKRMVPTYQYTNGVETTA